MNYTELAKEFNNMPNDVERWKWIKENVNLGITVWLDNDDTYATFDDKEDDDETPLLQFRGFIGNSDGIDDLLSVMNIKSSGV